MQQERRFFSVISEEDTICPCCGSVLKVRDHRKRIHRTAGGKTEWYEIRRLKCTGPECGRLHNELPDCIVPYKHYGAELIEDVIDEVVSAEDTETEDYPSEGTMEQWKRWYEGNRRNIEGQMGSMLAHLLDLEKEFQRFRESLLEGLRERISPGWLSVVIRILYNTGGRIEPSPG